jgi:CheY-like chemotaxis protein
MDEIYPSSKNLTSPGEASGHKRGNETILFVEDEDSLRTVIAEFLTELGYRVLTARSGPDALKIFEATSDGIHLLLTDVSLAPMTGPELARTIWTTSPQTRVVYISGFSTEDLSLQVGPRKCILVQKPFSVKVLSIKIREALDIP